MNKIQLVHSEESGLVARPLFGPGDSHAADWRLSLSLSLFLSLVKTKLCDQNGRQGGERYLLERFHAFLFRFNLRLQQRHFLRLLRLGGRRLRRLDPVPRVLAQRRARLQRLGVCREVEKQYRFVNSTRPGDRG